MMPVPISANFTSAVCPTPSISPRSISVFPQNSRPIKLWPSISIDHPPFSNPSTKRGLCGRPGRRAPSRGPPRRRRPSAAAASARYQSTRVGGRHAQSRCRGSDVVEATARQGGGGPERGEALAAQGLAAVRAEGVRPRRRRQCCVCVCVRGGGGGG